MSLVNTTGSKGLGLTTPAFRTGRFYTIPCLLGKRLRCNYASGTAWSADTIYYQWFSLSKPMTLVSLSVWVIDCAANPKKYAVGIYTDNAGLPGTLLISSGGVTVAAGTANAVSTTNVTSTILPVGEYWLAFVSNTAYASGGADDWQLDQYRDPSQNIVDGCTLGRSSMNPSNNPSDAYVTEARAWSDATPLPTTVGSLTYGRTVNGVTIGLGT